MTEKRTKLPKVVYSVEEEDWLISHALEYIEIIENKRTDGAAKRDKDKAWDEITEGFNTAPPGKERSVKSLREKYAKIKQSLRNRLFDFSKDAKQTDGGEPKELPPLSEPMQELFKILISSTCGLSATTGDNDFTVDEKPTMLREPPNILLNNMRRRLMDATMDKPKKIPRLLEERQQHLAAKHAIELEILECEREKHKLECEKAMLDVQRAEFDRERSLIELERAKNQLAYDNELHNIRMANLREGQVEQKYTPVLTAAVE